MDLRLLATESPNKDRIVDKNSPLFPRGNRIGMKVMEDVTMPVIDRLGGEFLNL